MAITRQERLVKAWVKNDNLSLIDMYNKCREEGWMDYLVETQESIREFIIDKVSNGIWVAPLLQSIEDDTSAELFKFDSAGWSNNPAKPIYEKAELAQALGY